MTKSPEIKFALRQGYVRLRIKTPHGNQWISTGETTYPRAREVCDAAKIQELQQAALAGVLTHDVISRLLTGRRLTCADLLTRWREEVADRLAADSLASYEQSLREWLTSARLDRQPISSVGRRAIAQWVNAPSVAIAGRKLRLAAIRSFYKFACALGLSVGNPATLVEVRTADLLFPELEAKETFPLAPEEYALLMASPKVTGFWRAAIPLGYWLGLRLRDVACLEWASIRGNSFIFYPQKTRRRLELPLDEPLLGAGELCRVFLGMLDQSCDKDFCFPEQRACVKDVKKRAKLSVQFQRLLKAHGIEGRRFHSLRHSAAVRLKEAGKTLEDIGTVLGHRDTKTTAIYTSHD